MSKNEGTLAVFIDFENLTLGLQGRGECFDITRVLGRLVEKGKIVAKKAYADWNRFSVYTGPLHEAAVELVEIRLVVDAIDLAYSKNHIDTFVIVSGDSDFSPLVSKLKELGKHVIGLGTQESTSALLRDNCDEFIYYEDLGRTPTPTAVLDSHIPEAKRQAFALLLDSLLALRRENKEVLWSSAVKDTMKRKRPSFSESYHGYRTFSELLEDAQREGLVELGTDDRSGTYVVTRFGSEMSTGRNSLPVGRDEDPPPPRRRATRTVGTAARVRATGRRASGNVHSTPRESTPVAYDHSTTEREEGAIRNTLERLGMQAGIREVIATLEAGGST